jgi:hypothetical protein
MKEGRVCVRMKSCVVVNRTHYDEVGGGGGGVPRTFTFNPRPKVVVVCSAICEGSSRGCPSAAKESESSSGVMGLMLMVG